LEKKYYDEMLSYLHKTLRVNIPISTNNFYTKQPNLLAQNQGDYINTHVFWDHPIFPEKAWDSNNFKYNNMSIINQNSQNNTRQSASTFIGNISLSAIENKPLVVSEWNICSPNKYEYEAASLITSYSLLQDWDGLFIYTFSFNDFWNKQNKNFDWFSIINNPVKMSQMPSNALAFIRGDFKPSPNSIILNYSTQDLFNNYLEDSKKPLDYNTSKKIPYSTIFIHKIRKSFSQDVKSSLRNETLDNLQINKLNNSKVFSSDTNEIVWNAEIKGQEYLVFNSPKYQGFNGFISNKNLVTNNLNINVDSNCAITLSPMDALFIDESKKLLLTVVSEQKRLNSTEYYSTLLKAVCGTITIKINAPYKYKVYSLDPSGKRKDLLAIKYSSNSITFEIGKNNTLWYEIVSSS
jgi:hypothetical protein